MADLPELESEEKGEGRAYTARARWFPILTVVLVLAALGCDIAQGYAIARPMPVDDFLTWLDEPTRPLLGSARAS